MFIDKIINTTTGAPAERNVSRDEYARPATFRSSGAENLLEPAFYKRYVPTGRESPLEESCREKKKLSACFPEWSELVKRLVSLRRSPRYSTSLAN